MIDYWVTISILVIGLISFFVELITTNLKIKDRNKKLKEIEFDIRESPQKTKPAWDLARTTLESYFEKNLKQIDSIYFLCIIVLLIGFGIIFWGINLSAKSPESFEASIIAGIAGAITEFIAATFLYMYKSTIKQAMDYSKTLERINAVGMAMQILDTIPDEVHDADLKNCTKAEVVKLLMKNYSENEALDKNNK